MSKLIPLKNFAGQGYTCLFHDNNLIYFYVDKEYFCPDVFHGYKNNVGKIKDKIPLLHCTMRGCDEYADESTIERGISLNYTKLVLPANGLRQPMSISCKKCLEERFYRDKRSDLQFKISRIIDDKDIDLDLLEKICYFIDTNIK
uniref:Uncharacterized protein n=1 Tax=Marseillevirus LCMAC102 TaxID=2506603 RepID=A0A481YT09_9VIRU|nr:MAG: hypothetical protein LCMAC102_02080 [Marseillevirus LCMAC102]